LSKSKVGGATAPAAHAGTVNISPSREFHRCPPFGGPRVRGCGRLPLMPRRQINRKKGSHARNSSRDGAQRSHPPLKKQRLRKLGDIGRNTEKSTSRRYLLPRDGMRTVRVSDRIGDSDRFAMKCQRLAGEESRR
jgi:hypothetical protein